MSIIAISAKHGGQGLDAAMDDRFGRAEAFLVVVLETREVIETIDNVSANAPHGAGTGATYALKSAGVGAVISGRFGPNAFDALRALGIEAWIAPPGITAGEALTIFKDGGLERMKS